MSEQRRLTIGPDHPMYRMVLRDLRPRNSETGGEVRYRQCGLCGHTEWISSSVAATGDLVASIAHMSPGECAQCQETFMRAPELARWVQDVAVKLHADVMREIEARAGRTHPADTDA